ncbi:MAG: hypothetical protein ACKVP2_17640 [Burkholderiales bacterium]
MNLGLAGMAVLAITLPQLAVSEVSMPLQDETVRLAQAPARGLRFEVFLRLEREMSEGELLTRAGEPDRETFDAVTRNAGGQYIVKTWTYLPTRSDPYVTTIQLTGGRISGIERERQF